MNWKTEYRVTVVGALGYSYVCGYQGFDESKALADVTRLAEREPSREYIIQTRHVSEWV